MFKNEIINFFKKTLKRISSFAEYTDLSSSMNRELYIGTITPQVAEMVDKTVRMWNRADDNEMVEWGKRAPIKIYMNSVGGDFNSMTTIMDAIKLSKTPVYTINNGTVQKEAFYIFISGHQRYAYPRASFLYERDLKHLDDEDRSLDNYIAFYERQLGEIKDMLLEKTKITETEYNKHLKGTWWMTAEDAHKLRICNEVLLAYQNIR